VRGALAVCALALALAGGACGNKDRPPPCDSTECCELYQQDVLDACTAEEDEVHDCAKKAKHAYEACMEQVR